MSNKNRLYIKYLYTYYDISDMQNTFFYSEQSRESHDLIATDSFI